MEPISSRPFDKQFELIKVEHIFMILIHIEIVNMRFNSTIHNKEGIFMVLDYDKDNSPVLRFKVGDIGVTVSFSEKEKEIDTKQVIVEMLTEVYEHRATL